MDKDFYEQMNGPSGCGDSASCIPEILARLDRNEELMRALVKYLSPGNAFEGLQLPSSMGGNYKKSKREKKLAKQVKKLKKQKKKLAKQVKSNYQQPETPWLQKTLSECASKAIGIVLDEISLRRKAKYALPSKKPPNVIDLPPSAYKVI